MKFTQNQNIYREEIMDLYSRRPNFGKLENPTIKTTHKNPVCNDEITIELEIKNNKVINAKFSGVSCFVSTISASALLENIKGKTINQIHKLSKKDIDKFLGINITPARINCELLPLEAIKKIK